MQTATRHCICAACLACGWSNAVRHACIYGVTSCSVVRWCWRTRARSSSGTGWFRVLLHAGAQGLGASNNRRIGTVCLVDSQLINGRHGMAWRDLCCHLERSARDESGHVKMKWNLAMPSLTSPNLRHFKPCVAHLMYDSPPFEHLKPSVILMGGTRTGSASATG